MKTNNFMVVLALICLFAMVRPTVALSQPISDSAANFITLSAYYDQYYDSLVQLRGADSMKGTGYKDYLRWKWFYSPRHGVEGDLGEMWESIEDYYENFDAPQGFTDNSDWQFMGPLGIPLGPGQSSSQNTGKGMMISLWVSPGNHSLIYAGSHHGGLWKTTDGGENWFPLHDNDARIHGVNSIAVDPNDNDIVYITANTSLGGFSDYSAGLFKSIDGGNSWQELSPGISYPASNKSSSVRKIVIDPNDTRNLYFVSYRNVFRSKDQGANWDMVFFKNYDPWDNQGYFTNHNGLWDLEITPWDTSVAYLAGSEIFKIDSPLGIFDTTNISDNVFLIGLNPGDTMINHPHRCEISINGNFRHKIWFGYTADYHINGVDINKLRIVMYDILNNTYHLVLDENNQQYFVALSAGKFEFEVSPSDSNVFYIGGIGIMKADTIQSAFDLIMLFDTQSEYPDSCWIHIDMRDMQIFSDGHGNDTLYLANDAGISWGTPFKGGNGNCTDESWYWRHPFSSIENGLNVTEFYGIGLSESQPDLVAGGCQDLSNMHNNNGDWTNFGDGDGSELIWDPQNPNIFYFSEFQTGWLFRTNDLETEPDNFFDMQNISLFMPMELDPRDASILYSGDTNLYKFTGVNNFTEAVQHQTIYDFPVGISDIEAVKAYIDSRWLYVSTFKTYNSDVTPSSAFTECIYRLEANGSSIYDISANLDCCRYGYISDIEVNPDNKSQLWVATVNYSKNSIQKKKVYTSSNSGNSWQDYSQGLPLGMPVFEIRYIPGYDYLLAATDVGIFKRDMQDTAWFPFSQNLPAGKIVTDLEVNLKFNTIVASTYGRGLWKSPLLCDYQETPWVIREDLTLERDTILDRSVTITDGFTLTIRNCRVHLPTEAKIVVERGGTLVLDGSTLTSACFDLWWGVEVWGDSHYTQASAVQGEIEMRNGAVIEKARKAVFCGKNIENTYPDWAYTGGIVDARNAIFKNNRYGVQLWSYHFAQDSTLFTGCKFYTTEILADGSNPEYFLTLAQVNGVKIEGCEFEYMLTGEPDYTKHGRGIYAIDAGFEILTRPYSTEVSKFKNLNCGVFALKLYENLPVSIHNSVFTKNLTGIYASGIETLELYLNEFYVNIDSIPIGTLVFGGVYLDHCTGYMIEENTFGSLISGTGTSSIGLTINNSGEALNEIYKNTFNNLYIGTLAQNINRSKDYRYGLKINCNVYNLNEYDIAVTGSQGCGECGISILQGSLENPAGNLFSWQGDHPNSDFDNQMAQVEYYHHRAVLGDTNRWIPIYYTDKTVTLHGTQVEWGEDTCSSRLGSIRNKELNIGLFESASMVSDSLETLLLQLIDGGSTNALEMEITFAESDEALELRDELLGSSPYLSDTILIKSVEKEDVLAPVMVKEIMVANPQSAKSDKIIEALENREIPIPDYMMTDILQGKDTVAAKEILEADLSWSDLQREIALNRLISIYRNDTSGVQTDSIISLLQNFNTLSATYRLMMTYFEMGDTLSALNKLNNIPQQFDLSSSQALIHQHWNELFEVMLQLKSDSLMVQNKDTTQLSNLSDLSIYEDLPGCLSRNMLHYLGIAETGPYYLLPEDQLKGATIKPSPNKDRAFVDQPFFTIYPNPAKNYIIVEYNIEDLSGDGLLTIYTQDGKLQLIKSLDHSKQHFIINTKDWSDGLYFFNFITHGRSNQTGKIIIAK